MVEVDISAYISPKKLCHVFKAAVEEHSASFSFELESTLEVVANSRQKKGKICGCFKTSNSVVLQQCP